MAGQEAVIAAFRNEHQRRLQVTRDLFQSYAAEAGNWMRANAKWIDRTGNARNSLEGIEEFTDEVFRLILKGGGPPDYVQFLELSRGGKYAVVRPALEHFAGLI
jgi:hypothetical protein